MSRENRKTVFVAMSGGVDSSVAAYLLKTGLPTGRQGYEVVGVFMRCYNIDGCAEKDAEDARRVAEHLKIPFYVWDFEEEYKKRVVEYMIEGYRKGITPNPDVMCNKEIKFGLFLKKALKMGADYVATGHYVRLRQSANNESNTNLRITNSQFVNSQCIRYSLMAARDAQKDQSYFLWTLTQEQLKHCLFPIGDYLKSEVREIARKAGLPTAEKKDSQGICFLGKVALPDFLKQYIPEKKGAVLTTTGQKIGEHNGAHFYTIGQRHIGISKIKNPARGEARQGQQKSNSTPFYVAEKNTKTNTIVVAEGSDNPALYKKEIELANVNYINPAVSEMLHVPCSMFYVYVRVRYRQPLANAYIMYQGARIKLVFDRPQKFIAPGQSAVFYLKNGELLGGGVIL